MAVYGYHRISTRDQKLERGILEIENFCRERRMLLEKIFTDQHTGRDFNRPGYLFLTRKILRRGDILIITELDRLGRNKSETMREIRRIRDKGVRLMILELPTTLIEMEKLDNVAERIMAERQNNRILEFYASMAQAELEKSVKRQKEGMKAKKLRGEWDEVGRPRVIEQEKFNREFMRVIKNEITSMQLRQQLGLTSSTFYRYRKRFLEKFPQFL